MALGTGADEDGLALGLQLVEGRIRIGQGKGPVADGVGERPNAVVREQHALKRRQVVEEPLRRHVLNLGVRLERPEGLLLEIGEPAVQLVTTSWVRAAEPWVFEVITRQLDVIDGGNHPPHVDAALTRRQVGRRIDEPDVRRQIERDPNQAVLPQIAEIVGVLAVRAEVVGVDRPEQRIVGLRIESSEETQKPESLFDVRRRELKMVRGHVAIGAGAAVSVQAAQASIQERQPAADNRSARLAPAVGGSSTGAGCRFLHAAGGDIGAGSDDKRGNEGYAAEDQE